MRLSMKGGIMVFMGLYLLTGPTKEQEPVQLTEALVAASDSFPLVYQPKTESFELHQLESTDITRMRLTKALNPLAPLTLLPGHWGVELKATNGMDRLKSHERYYFTVEPGKHYVLNIKWETQKGVKQMAFELEEKK